MAPVVANRLDLLSDGSTSLGTATPTDAQSVAASSQESPRQGKPEAAHVLRPVAAPLMSSPPSRRGRVEWCDIRDEDEEDHRQDMARDCSAARSLFKGMEQAAQSPQSASGTPSKRRTERRRRRKDVEAPSWEHWDAAAARQTALGARQAPSSQVASGVVTLGDIGLDVGDGAASPACLVRNTGGDASMRSPTSVSGWMMPMSPCQASPTARPLVMLPPGALGTSGLMGSMGIASQSPVAATGDASTRALPGCGTPLFSWDHRGDASVRGPMSLGLVGDASTRSNGGCCDLNWAMQGAMSPMSIGDAASPCRLRQRQEQLGAYNNGFVCTSPVAHCGLVPVPQGPWSPVGSREADTIRCFFSASGLPSGAELAAQLRAAAPESYED